MACNEKLSLIPSPDTVHHIVLACVHWRTKKDDGDNSGGGSKYHPNEIEYSLQKLLPDPKTRKIGQCNSFQLAKTRSRTNPH